MNAGQPAEIPGADGAEAVRISQQRLEREFGPIPVAMLATSLAVGRPNAYLTANEAFCQLTGYSQGELGTADFIGDVHPDDQPAVEALIQQIRAGQTGEIRTAVRLVRKDGGLAYVRLTGTAIQPDAGERYLASFVEDATAAEQAQGEIRQLEQELLHSRRLESVGQLVGGIGHDFNNLLTVIANYASLVRDEVSVAESTESATRWGPVRWDVEQIEDAADRAKRLIRNLLATARREEAEPVLVDVGQLVNDVTQMLGEVLGEHVPVLTRPAAGLWPVEADPGQLEQVIINIAVNARDAMPAGGQVTIATANIDTAGPGAVDLVAGRPDAADVAELLPGRYVELRITDTGTGMDAATAERAFDPFFTTKGGDQAAGLGLAAIRRFATRAGGRSWLRSEPGIGTTVTVMLPAAPGAGSGVFGRPAARPGTAPERARSVIVVDDEMAIRDVAHRVLTSAGHRVTTAASGLEALGLLRDPNIPADLLLTDVVMPGLTGQTFADQARAVRPGIRMLFMSGYEPGSAAAGSWPGPETHVIAKPFSRAALLARVTQVLAAGAEAAAGRDTGAEQNAGAAQAMAAEQATGAERLMRADQR